MKLNIFKILIFVNFIYQKTVFNHIINSSNFNYITIAVKILNKRIITYFNFLILTICSIFSNNNASNNIIILI